VAIGRDGHYLGAAQKPPPVRRRLVRIPDRRRSPNRSPGASGCEKRVIASREPDRILYPEESGSRGGDHGRKGQKDKSRTRVQEYREEEDRPKSRAAEYRRAQGESERIEVGGQNDRVRRYGPVGEPQVGFAHRKIRHAQEFRRHAEDRGSHEQDGFERESRQESHAQEGGEEGPGAQSDQEGCAGCQGTRPRQAYQDIRKGGRIFQVDAEGSHSQSGTREGGAKACEEIRPQGRAGKGAAP
jgi:hypothetical protein